MDCGRVVEGRKWHKMLREKREVKRSGCSAVRRGLNEKYDVRFKLARLSVTGVGEFGS